MGLLGEIYSTIDSKKRQLKGLLSEPVETIRQGLLNFRDDQNKLLNDFGVGYQTPGYKSVLTSPEQVKAARQSVADWGANQGIGAATVWHGSPHKFNKFDSSKIGTGEGAQAYGHGLYLAESPDVASAYRKNLSKDTFVSPNGSVINRAKLSDFGFDKSDIDVMLGAIQRHDGDFFAAADAMASHRPTAAKFLKGIGQQGAMNEGSLYKVDLPDEAIAKMLDWDKPLSQQPESVRPLLIDVMRKRGLPVDESGMPYWVKSDPNGEAMHAAFGSATAKTNSKAQATAADLMRQAGIPGIRYLDGGSRGAGQGTSNYVIFPGNENLLTILERNGQPVGLLD